MIAIQKLQINFQSILAKITHILRFIIISRVQLVTVVLEESEGVEPPPLPEFPPSSKTISYFVDCFRDGQKRLVSFLFVCSTHGAPRNLRESAPFTRSYEADVSLTVDIYIWCWWWFRFYVALHISDDERRQQFVNHNLYTAINNSAVRIYV